MMTRYDPDRHHRQSIRLPQYDYSRAGAYFVTICTRERECVFDDPVMRGIVTDVWWALPDRFPTIALDAFVVMPNHIHLIVWLHPSDEGGHAEAGDRAGTSERAGATTGAGDGVGATLAVAPMDTTGAGDGVGATPAVAPTVKGWLIPEPKTFKTNPTLGDVIGTFKSLVFAVYLDWIERHDPTRRAKFWQRNYYKHIIRNERELRAIRQYIADNPDRWAHDTYNPAAAGPDPRAVELMRLLQEGG